ncbi:LysR family transcriptional regulator [Paraburkholderia sediminicola]|uniref:LysR family transcriptional regulator n=1 Tax=Paraburkholderia sediminicola TaxID=458836 RepID=UPI0038BD1B25
MNLRQLEHIVALAEEGSFARAAQRVHLSQPALSRSIQAIEQFLGTALFDRTTREVRITPTGQTVVRRAKKVLFETRCLLRDVDLIKNHDIGSVNFGAGPYPASMLLPAALDDLAQNHPRLRVNVTVDNWKQLLTLLHEEALDFVMIDVRGIPTTSEIDFVSLPRQRAGWFVRKGHPLAGRNDVETQALHDYPILSVPLPDAMQQSLRKWLRYAPNQEMEFHLTCNDVNVLREYAKKTDALVLLTTNAMRHPADAGELVPLSLPSRSSLTLQCGIAHLAGRTLSPAAQQCIVAIRRIAAVYPQAAPLD